MAKTKKPGQKNRVVHRPQIGTFAQQDGAKPVEEQEDYGYKVEAGPDSDAPEKTVSASEVKVYAKNAVEIKHTSPKVLVKPLIVVASCIGAMLLIKLVINLVSG